ncbi:MAG: hypothetical protein ABIW82_11620 [Dokdonella sp.]
MTLPGTGKSLQSKATELANRSQPQAMRRYMPLAWRKLAASIRVRPNPVQLPPSPHTRLSTSGTHGPSIDDLVGELPTSTHVVFARPTAGHENDFFRAPEDRFDETRRFDSAFAVEPRDMWAKTMFARVNEGTTRETIVEATHQVHKRGR